MMLKSVCFFHPSFISNFLQFRALTHDRSKSVRDTKEGTWKDTIFLEKDRI